jgi:uncharacterized membrane-anchored protein YhcB (DUF1043 family)
MKNKILKELNKLNFNVDNRHNEFEVVSKEIETKFGWIDISIKFHFSKSLEFIKSVSVDYFNLFDNLGNEIYINISDKEIINNINY